MESGVRLSVKERENIVVYAGVGVIKRAVRDIAKVKGVSVRAGGFVTIQIYLEVVLLIDF